MSAIELKMWNIQGYSERLINDIDSTGRIESVYKKTISATGCCVIGGTLVLATTVTIAATKLETTVGLCLSIILLMGTCCTLAGCWKQYKTREYSEV